MSLRRWVAAFAALLISSVAIFSHAEGVSNSASTRSALFGPSDHAVQKDNSNLTVVEAAADGTPPVVDTATKKRSRRLSGTIRFFIRQSGLIARRKNNRSRGRMAV